MYVCIYIIIHIYIYVSRYTTLCFFTLYVYFILWDIHIVCILYMLLQLQGPTQLKGKGRSGPILLHLHSEPDGRSYTVEVVQEPYHCALLHNAPGVIHVSPPESRLHCS